MPWPLFCTIYQNAQGRAPARNAGLSGSYTLVQGGRVGHPNTKNVKKTLGGVTLPCPAMGSIAESEAPQAPCFRRRRRPRGYHSSLGSRPSRRQVGNPPTTRATSAVRSLNTVFTPCRRFVSPRRCCRQQCPHPRDARSHHPGDHCSNLILWRRVGRQGLLQHRAPSRTMGRTQPLSRLCAASFSATATLLAVGLCLCTVFVLPGATSSQQLQPKAAADEQAQQAPGAGPPPSSVAAVTAAPGARRPHAGLGAVQTCSRQQPGSRAPLLPAAGDEQDSPCLPTQSRRPHRRLTPPPLSSERQQGAAAATVPQGGGGGGLSDALTSHQQGPSRRRSLQQQQQPQAAAPAPPSMDQIVSSALAAGSSDVLVAQVGWGGVGCVGGVDEWGDASAMCGAVQVACCYGGAGSRLRSGGCR